jgi:hypothetical protein
MDDDGFMREVDNSFSLLHSPFIVNLMMNRPVYVNYIISNTLVEMLGPCVGRELLIYSPVTQSPTYSKLHIDNNGKDPAPPELK